jgi:hypothetical protein
MKLSLTNHADQKFIRRYSGATKWIVSRAGFETSKKKVQDQQENFFLLLSFPFFPFLPNKPFPPKNNGCYRLDQQGLLL